MKRYFQQFIEMVLGRRRYETAHTRLSQYILSKVPETERATKSMEDIRLGLVHSALGKRDWDTAFAHLLAIQQHDPTDLNALFVMGRIANGLDRDEQAEAIFRTLLRRTPHTDNPGLASVCLVDGLLRAGSLQAGYRALRSWVETEQHQRTVQKNAMPPYPLWNGGYLKEKRLLLWSDRGFGDAIQYLRFVPQIASRGVQVVLGMPPELERLSRTVEGAVHVCSRTPAITDIGRQLPFTLIPTILDVTWKQIPTKPYLSHPTSVVPLPVAQPGALKVGLVWRVSFNDHADERIGLRSLPSAYLYPLLHQPGVEWYSLQKGQAVTDLTREGVQERIHDLDPLLHDFADTASVISQLDLVITVDTAVAHVAGALGKDVWVLVPLPADSRWLVNRTDSPWYPTMRLFRQRERGLWIDPVSELLTALQAWTGQRNNGSQSYLDHRAILRPKKCQP